MRLCSVIVLLFCTGSQVEGSLNFLKRDEISACVKKNYSESSVVLPSIGDSQHLYWNAAFRSYHKAYFVRQDPDFRSTLTVVCESEKLSGDRKVDSVTYHVEVEENKYDLMVKTDGQQKKLNWDFKGLDVYVKHCFNDKYGAAATFSFSNSINREIKFSAKLQCFLHSNHQEITSNTLDFTVDLQKYQLPDFKNRYSPYFELPGKGNPMIVLIKKFDSSFFEFPLFRSSSDSATEKDALAYRENFCRKRMFSWKLSGTQDVISYANKDNNNDYVIDSQCSFHIDMNSDSGKILKDQIIHSQATEIRLGAKPFSTSEDLRYTWKYEAIKLLKDFVNSGNLRAKSSKGVKRIEPTTDTKKITVFLENDRELMQCLCLGGRSTDVKWTFKDKEVPASELANYGLSYYQLSGYYKTNSLDLSKINMKAEGIWKCVWKSEVCNAAFDLSVLAFPTFQASPPGAVLLMANQSVKLSWKIFAKNEKGEHLKGTNYDTVKETWKSKIKVANSTDKNMITRYDATFEKMAVGENALFKLKAENDYDGKLVQLTNSVALYVLKQPTESDFAKTPKNGGDGNFECELKPDVYPSTVQIWRYWLMSYKNDKKGQPSSKGSMDLSYKLLRDGVVSDLTSSPLKFTKKANHDMKNILITCVIELYYKKNYGQLFDNVKLWNVKSQSESPLEKSLYPPNFLRTEKHNFGQLVFSTVHIPPKETSFLRQMYSPPVLFKAMFVGIVIAVILVIIVSIIVVIVLVRMRRKEREYNLENKEERRRKRGEKEEEFQEMRHGATNEPRKKSFDAESDTGYAIGEYERDDIGKFNEDGSVIHAYGKGTDDLELPKIETPK